MATITVADRINFGNMHLQILNVTSASSSGTSHKVGSTVWGVKALNNTDTADTFGETVGAHSSSSTRNQITITPVTNNDNGQVWVWYR